MLGLILAGLLLVQAADKPATIALVIDGQTEFTSTTSAERLYDALEQKRKGKGLSSEENKWHAALTLSLGTLRQDVIKCVAAHRAHCDIVRGVRLPLQGGAP